MFIKFRKCLLGVFIVFASIVSFSSSAAVLDEDTNVQNDVDHSATQVGNNCTSKDVCLTKTCTLTAAMLISAMDTTFDPCEKFYDFTCANFIRTNPVPDDKKKASSFHNFNSNFDLQLKNVVEGMGSLKAPKLLYRMQEAYHVCINTTYQPEKEINALRNFFRTTLDWPLAWGKDEWKPKFDTLSEYMAHYEANGFQSVWTNMFIHPNEEDTAYKIFIKCDSPENVLARTLIKRNPMNVDFVKELLQLIGNDDGETLLEQQLEYIQDFLNATKQSNMVDGDEMNTTSTVDDEMMTNLTFRELYEMTNKQIDWLKIANSKMRNKHVFTEDDTVTMFTPVETCKENYAHLLENLSMRSLVTIMGWKSIPLHLLIEAGPKMEKLILKRMEMEETLDEEEEETVKPQPRWKRCLDSITLAFNLGVTRLFLDKYIDRAEKKSADELIQWIAKAYIQNLRESDWLDETTKANAIQKAEMITRHVGYPDFILDDDRLDKYYENILPEIHSTHFQNVLDFYIHYASKFRVNVIDKDGEGKEENWEFSPLMVNAFYNPLGNSIWMPSGILQLPFFQENRLAALNFGMIGSIIGHEIGHAFDNQGSTYDGRGKKVNWWSNETGQTFVEKSECFVNQYDKYCPEELQGGDEDICVKGSQTLGENLADYTGLDAAFIAYKMWVKEHGPEKRLPGLQEFTPEQLFFIGYGYLWCENVPADKWLSNYEYDSHSPGRYRALGTLSNSHFFKEVFHCPKGPMNRDDESCTVW